MNKLYLIFIFVLSYKIYTQPLPKKDFGIFVSYGYANRHLEKTESINGTSAIFLPSFELRRHYNITNHFSIKTGVSISTFGQKVSFFGYWGSYGNTTVYNYNLNFTASYLSIPSLLSYNFKNFYIDAGLSPALRISKTQMSVRGNRELTLKLNYICEMHIGHYFPIKQRRISVALSAYITEINNKIHMKGKGDYYVGYKNAYSNNYMISIGYMFGKLKSNTELVK